MKKRTEIVVLVLVTIMVGLNLTSCAETMEGLGGLSGLGSKIMDINDSDNGVELFADEGYGEIIAGKSYYMREYQYPENSPNNSGGKNSQIIVNNFEKNKAHKVYIEKAYSPEGYYYIKSSDSDYIWTVAKDSSDAGTVMILSGNSGLACQKFSFEYTDEEDVYLINSYNGGYVYNNNGKLILADYSDNENDNEKLKWKLTM